MRLLQDLKDLQAGRECPHHSTRTLVECWIKAQILPATSSLAFQLEQNPHTLCRRLQKQSYVRQGHQLNSLRICDRVKPQWRRPLQKFHGPFCMPASVKKIAHQ